jgi:medium-chain acyl-[acyl-carrier-protein] hydrolase
LKLYCLSHAGGSANLYLAWRRHLDPSIELVPVELSGRGRRITSPLRATFAGVLDDATSEVTRTPVPVDYALFGHSFGALIAFELAHTLVARGHRPPRHLFVSGSCAPERVAEIEIALSDENDELIRSLAHLGGTPEEILADHEAVELFGPILRADLRALFDYRSSSSAKLDCDVSVLLGDTDTVATQLDADLWAERFAGETFTRVVDGGHFAVLEDVDSITGYVNGILLKAAAYARTGSGIDSVRERQSRERPAASGGARDGLRQGTLDTPPLY